MICEKTMQVPVDGVATIECDAFPESGHVILSIACRSTGFSSSIHLTADEFSRLRTGIIATDAAIAHVRKP